MVALLKRATGAIRSWSLFKKELLREELQERRSWAIKGEKAVKNCQKQMKNSFFFSNLLVF